MASNLYIHVPVSTKKRQHKSKALEKERVIRESYDDKGDFCNRIANVFDDMAIPHISLQYVLRVPLVEIVEIVLVEALL